MYICLIVFCRSTILCSVDCCIVFVIEIIQMNSGCMLASPALDGVCLHSCRVNKQACLVRVLAMTRSLPAIARATASR